MKKTMLVLITALLTTALQADVILSTDFNGVTKSGTTITSNWTPTTGVEDIVSGILTTSDNSVLSLVKSNVLSPKLFLTNATTFWEFDIALNLQSGFEGTFSGVDFTSKNLNGQGQGRNSGRLLNYEITLSDSNGTLATTNENFSGNGTERALNFDTAVLLNDQVDYTLTLKVSGFGTGAHGSIDNLNLNGTVMAFVPPTLPPANNTSATPEPSSYALMLLGLCGLALGNKKRKSSQA